MFEGGETFVVRSTGCVRFIPRSDVRWIEAVRHYVRLHLEDGTVLYRCTMTALERALPSPFVRIHRSYIVRSDLVRRLSKRKNGRYEVGLNCGTEVPVGDKFLDSTRDSLGL